MSKRDAYRNLYQALEEAGLLEYGATIPQEFIYEVLEIEMPQSAPKSVFDAIALAELSAVDFVRNALLAQGKYITSTRTGYRVLLPSENLKQVELYMESADKKLNRALKLSRNTPAQVGGMPDQTEARILMKRDNIHFTNRFRGNSP